MTADDAERQGAKVLSALWALGLRLNSKVPVGESRYIQQTPGFSGGFV
jgi:hypothetical protein